MKEYVAVVKHEKTLSVCFYIEQDKIMSIGEKMNEHNEEAYMNGYNWSAFLEYYVSKHQPELLQNMGSDPEAGMYVAYYDLTIENERKAEKFAALIEGLVENEDKILAVIKNEGEEIAWD